MSNPVFDRLDTITKDRTPNGYPQMPGYQPGSQNPQSYQATVAGTYTQPGATDMRQYEQMYSGPAADSVDTGRITYDDVLIKSAVLFALVLGSAAVNWYLFLMNPGLGVMLTGIGAIGGLVTALVNIFKREPSPVLVMAYGVFEGLLLGGISLVFNNAYPGVVMQAMVASFVVFGVTLFLFSFGFVRNSSKLMMVGLVGIISLGLLQLVNWVLIMFNLTSSPWGIEGGTIFGIPVAALLGIIVVILGAISFIGDFDQIKQAVNRQIPQKYSWTLAFGLMVTLIWLYVNLLRYASILAGRD
ncbi:Bax inhibitor-1/YccA family protein [Boudabousia marimammalium]|uniref:Bax inhibitor-1/YccA family protein n=1 Tax=Boudabousia marimammalium TaxID=156892 RepID=A0A1Q5PRQ8_9ACTO|nr:Bax inhibitor-1/YccA family protein [Boudabousia marimammalium]OKL50267.1 hypothetical protein BM477_02435 [Boudabousia marimammalium]